MKLTFEKFDHLVVYTINGDLTVDQSDQLRTQATQHMAANVRDYVLDVAGLEYADSVGLESLIWLQDECSEKLGQVRLANVGENFGKILEITRLASRFDRHPDVDAAIKSLRCK